MQIKFIVAVASLLSIVTSYQVAASEIKPVTPDGNAKEDALPLSKDDLFDTTDRPETSPSATQVNDTTSDSKSSLFGLDTQPTTPINEAHFPITGYIDSTLAYTYSHPSHWSEILGRAQLSTKGHLGQGVNWKATGRVDYNAAYEASDYYAEAVRHAQRTKFQFEETYLDFSTGILDWRVGKQQIVWGEMVGLFFADVVSAKDLREFILPDFDVLRIPQWATRAEYFKDNFHAEMIWIPIPSYDLIGTPYQAGQPGAGTDYYPYPVSPAGPPIIKSEEKPNASLSHSNYGIRLTQLSGGWDYSGFLYSSMDSNPTYYRDAIDQQVFYPKHDRIWQGGGTIAKDLGAFVFKGEAVYTNGRHFNVTNLAPGNGVVEQDTLDWVIGLDFNPTVDTRLNTQFFQRVFINHAPDTLFDKFESGISLLVNHKLPHNLEAEALLIHSLNRNDWMLRPKVTWRFRQDWKMAFGLDIFGGPPTGLFGQYDEKDRVYTQVKYDF